MKKLIKALNLKIKEITGLVSGFKIDIAKPETPHFEIEYKGLTTKKYRVEIEKLTMGMLKFDITYQSQMNSIGDVVNYIENELNLLKLFKYTMAASNEKQAGFKIDDVGDYRNILLIAKWNDNDISRDVSSFTTGDYEDAKRTFKLQLHYTT